MPPTTSPELRAYALLTLRDYDYRFGIHSNIPRCCARFFVTRVNARGHLAIGRLNQRRRRREGPAAAAASDRRGVGPEYVMCPRCYRRWRRGELTPAELHICTDSRDGPFCHAHLSRFDLMTGRRVKTRYRLRD